MVGEIRLSAHCAPSLHVAPTGAAQGFRHLEYFHDHARIEHRLFDGTLTPQNGALHPALTRPSMALEFKKSDPEQDAV
jgi:hypothetical protein